MEPLPLALQNIGYPSETHLKLKSREVSFAHNLFVSSSIALTFDSEHGRDTDALCPKSQNDWTTQMDDIDERDFARFEFKRSFGG